MGSYAKRISMTVSIIALVLAFGIPINSAHTQGFRFDPAINLSNNGASTIDYETTVDDSNVYVVWSEGATLYGGTVGNGDIFFKASTDNGTTFGNVINLSKNSGNSIYPKIIVSGNNVYVVWQDDGTGGREIFFTRSTDNGARFSTPVNLSNDFSDSVFPQMAISGNNVYVVWQDGIASGVPDAALPNVDIFFKASTDNGATFGNVINLSKNKGYSQLPQITAKGSNVFVVWYDTTPGNFDIFLARSMDNGKSFSGAANISNTSGYSTHPQLAVSGSNVYVAWFDDTNHGGLGGDADVFFTTSTDSGNSFNEPITLITNPGKVGISSLEIAASGINVYAVWSFGTFQNSEVYFNISRDNGDSFGIPLNLSNNGGKSVNAQLAVYGNNVYVGWMDDTLGNLEAFLTVSTNDGASFSNIINLSSSEGQSGSPKITAIGNNVYAVWSDNTSGNGDTFFRAGRMEVLSTINITIDLVSNPKPRWGLDAVTVSGKVTNGSPMDTVTVNWGDGILTEGILIQNGSWGSASHFYNSTHVTQIIAKLLDEDGIEKANTAYKVDVQKHATKIIVSPIVGVEVGSNITVTGSLIDVDTDMGIGGKVVTLNGTGATTDLANLITNINGSFSLTGKSPSSVAMGWTVQAQFAGDDLYRPSVSPIVKYDTVKHTAVESIVQLSNIALVDSDGNKLNKISMGDQILIQCNLVNKQKKEQPLVYIVQIKDRDGHTVFLSWIKGSIQNSQSMKAAVTWASDVSGNYTVEIFVWESLTNPKPLSEMNRIELTVS